MSPRYGIALLALLLGCSHDTGRLMNGDGGLMDAGLDASPDAGPDASPDTGPGDTAVDPPDTGVDSTVVDSGAVDSEMVDVGVDATPDTGTPSTCGNGACDASDLMGCEYECRLVPRMTGSTSPSGTVTSSGDFGLSNRAWMAFDAVDSANTAGDWLSSTYVEPAWIAYEFGDGPKTVMRYGIRYTNGAIVTRAPRDWVLQGFDGSLWMTIDRRDGQTGWTNGEWRRFDIGSPRSFEAYRLRVTADNAGDASPIVVVHVAELGLWGM